MHSLVSALLPADTDTRSYTAGELANIETVLRLRSAPFSEREAPEATMEEVYHAAHEWPCSGEHLGGEGELPDERLEGG